MEEAGHRRASPRRGSLRSASRRPLETNFARLLVLAQSLEGAVADHALRGQLAVLELADQLRLDEMRFLRDPAAGEGTARARQRRQPLAEVAQVGIAEAGP